MTTKTRRSRFRLLATIGGWVVTGIGVSVLVVGWGAGVEALSRPFPVGEQMKANAALSLALLGLALLLRIRDDVSAERRRASILTCVIVALVAGATLFEYLADAGIGIDELLASAPATATSGRMAPSMAFSLLLLAAGIVAIDGRRWLTVTPTLLALLVGFVAGSGYLLGIEELYGVGELTGMAAHSSLAVVLLSVSVLSSRPDRDPVVRLSWNDSGGTVARLLIPVFAILFMAVTWVMEIATDRWGGGIPPEALLLDNVVLTSLLVILVWYLAGVLHDSELKRSEVTEQAMRDKDRFMASVGHELRTPVSALVGFAELLSGMGTDLPEEEKAKILDLMARQGSDLVALLEDLLVAARADTGALSVARVRVDLRAQVAQALESLVGRPPAVEEIIGSGVHVAGDPLRVRQILRNLLSNAARYGGDRVRVVVGDNGESGWVRVEDDGPGIAGGDQPRIFEPYVTFHGEAGRPGSVGLGLPVARSLAIRMGGTIEYRRDDGWTVFQVSLPLHRPDPDGFEPGRSTRETVSNRG